MSNLAAQIVIFLCVLLIVASVVGYLMGFGLNFLWVFRAIWDALRPMQLPAEKEKREDKPR